LHPTKGKGAPGKESHSLLFTKGSKGKGKGHGKGKGKPGKGKGLRKGKGGKGKQLKGAGRSLEDTCHFCKQAGHYKAQCPKYAALTSKTGYERIRAKLPNEKVYVYDMLEDSVGMDVCGNCLCCECDWETCTPPVECLLFHEASRSFVDDGMWDMVSKAKSSNPPLSKEFFCKHMDKMATAGRMRTARMKIMATSRRKETLLKRATDSAATWQTWNLCLSSFL
jgi:hypothetical protein